MICTIYICKCVYVLLISDMLLLGKTGKIIQPTHTNSGIASVARITLLRLVDPLKILNIDNKELLLLKEVVLFNPGKLNEKPLVPGSIT